ncbi:MAG TPA: SDR family oxidoreductase [Alphaproteobacteria bacterium]|nr:SDR family oxidoreductase [Alphaproteobacteria bacterium]
MPSVLITGANRGIGLEFARQYAAAGWRVFAACRDPARAKDLKELKGDVRVSTLDIGDFMAINVLARELEGEAIDVLVNNAGVYGPGPQTLESLDYDGWAETFRIDCMAQIYVSRAFLDHVAKSERKVIVALTSKMGSIDDNSGGGAYIYRSCKAALNAAFKSLAIDVAPRGIVAAVIHPGWVMTDMGGPNALISAAESVTAMRALIGRFTPRDSGRFWAYDGKEIPW